MYIPRVSDIFVLTGSGIPRWLSVRHRVTMGGMPFQFEDGPLADGRESQIHSLIIHMIGDGRSSIGYYRQRYDEDVPLGFFDWVPADEDGF